MTLLWGVTESTKGNYQRIMNCSATELSGHFGARNRIRIGDLILTKEALYQLSYAGTMSGFVEHVGVEPTTCSLPANRSSRLS